MAADADIAPRPIVGRPAVGRIIAGPGRRPYSVAMVRKWEDEGKLTPERKRIPLDFGRVKVRLVYDPGQVAALRKRLGARRKERAERQERKKWDREEGRLAAEVFKLLEAGKSKREIVIALGVHPANVDELYEHYVRTSEEAIGEKKAAERRKRERTERRDAAKEAARQEREAKRERDERRARRAAREGSES